MKGKKQLAIFMALAMACSVSACGSDEKADSAVPADSKGSGESQTQLTDSVSEVQEPDAAGISDAAYNVTWEDMADIIVMYPSMTAIPSGLQAVEDAINEITEEEINTHVTLKMIEVGNYDQQANLMISSNEQLDLMVTMPGGPTSFSTMVAQKQLIPMDELLKNYAPKAYDGVGDLIKGTQINGETYAFPTYKGFAGGITIFMRTDVLEDLNLMDKAINMTSFSEFEEILEAVKTSEKWGYLAGIASTDGHGAVLANNATVCFSENFADCTFFDNLGNTQFAVAVRRDGSNEVVNTFTTPEYKENYEIVKRWYDKGYVYKDSPTTKEMGTALVKSNVTFSYIAAAERGGEASADTTCGTDMTPVLITPMPISTGSLTKFTWAIPVTAKEPEAAATFLEMMFNDARIANLFAWGIEDVDYELGEDGVARYIEGNDNPAYHAVAFLNANKFLVHPWDGDDPNVNEIYKKYMDEADYSPYLGFAADTSSVSDQVSAMTNVIAQYQPQVVSGVADEATFQEFLDKLESSDIDLIVQLYQEQLNQWLEATSK